jgi:RNA polymerase sigma factor (sigma-70 family)
MSLTDMFAPDEQGVENRIDVERAIGRLTFKEATVLYLWAICEKSQAEIGEIIGLSQQHVSRILADMCKKA